MSANLGRLAGRLAAVILAAILLGACGAGATASPATPASTPSPVAVTDEALVADLAAVWSNPYDAAEVAALYAPDAAVHELTDANLTSTGLEAIQTRVRSLAAMDFKVAVTSAPIRQDSFVAAFSTYGEGEARWPGLVVYQLKDGKVVEQWVYEEGPPTDASPPAAETDEALVADLAALWSNPYDAADVAALYAPDAAIYDEISGSASATGLEAIQAKVEEYAAMPFKVKVTSAPIRQGDYVAVFQMFGSPDASNPGFMVLKLKDGKVESMWMYPAE
ncbi:MAG: nuclear transport factor 2 family protein [Chloroflexi bacterium]|nr:nuclear transport factor 2 family protein [Chloroflexota bacterium]